jgi:hypothetical protein
MPENAVKPNGIYEPEIIMSPNPYIEVVSFFSRKFIEIEKGANKEKFLKQLFGRLLTE